LLSLLIALVFALTIYSSKAKAQLSGILQPTSRFSSMRETRSMTTGRGRERNAGAQAGGCAGLWQRSPQQSHRFKQTNITATSRYSFNL